MKIGDLVHNPRYPYWGMGIVVAIGSRCAQVRWAIENEQVFWAEFDDLEVL